MLFPEEMILPEASRPRLIFSKVVSSFLKLGGHKSDNMIIYDEILVQGFINNLEFSLQDVVRSK